MAWQADPQTNRTFDPETGCELLRVDSFRNGPTTFRVVGPEGEFGFSASKMEAPITDTERAELGVVDAIVWTVIHYDEKSEIRRAMIADSLKAYKLGHGFNLGELAVLVRFGRNGTIADD